MRHLCLAHRVGRSVGALALVATIWVSFFAFEAFGTDVSDTVVSVSSCGDEVASSGGWVPFTAEALPERYVLPSKNRSDRPEHWGRMHPRAGQPQG